MQALYLTGRRNDLTEVKSLIDFLRGKTLFPLTCVKSILPVNG